MTRRYEVRIPGLEAPSGRYSMSQRHAQPHRVRDAGSAQAGASLPQSSRSDCVPCPDAPASPIRAAMTLPIVRYLHSYRKLGQCPRAACDGAHQCYARSRRLACAIAFLCGLAFPLRSPPFATAAMGPKSSCRHVPRTWALLT